MPHICRILLSKINWEVECICKCVLTRATTPSPQFPGTEQADQ